MDFPFGPGKEDRKDNRSLYRLLNLSAPDAAGADADPPWLSFDKSPDGLEIGLEKPF